MLVVEEVALGAGDEELATVGVLPAVGHGQEAGGVVLEGEVFVGECAAPIYAHYSSAVSLEIQKNCGVMALSIILFNAQPRVSQLLLLLNY